MTMRTVTATLESISPYSQGRAHAAPKLEKEGPDDYEQRTWRMRLHTDDKNRVIIPPMAFKNSLAECAKFLSVQIQGKGKATYTKHFEAGVMVVQPLVLGVKASDVTCERLFVPADGRRGSGKRVWKMFPVLTSWSGDVEFTILDDVITKPVFQQHLEEAGKFIGIGRFRPRNNGYYGRFKVTKILWS